MMKKKHPEIHVPHHHVDRIQFVKSNKIDLYAHVWPIILEAHHTVDLNVF